MSVEESIQFATTPLETGLRLHYAEQGDLMGGSYRLSPRLLRLMVLLQPRVTLALTRVSCLRARPARTRGLG
jgi:hypothetical protein